MEHARTACWSSGQCDNVLYNNRLEVHAPSESICGVFEQHSLFAVASVDSAE